MARAKSDPLKSLLDAPRVREAARALIDAVEEEVRERELTPKRYERALQEIARLRGRPLAFPALASGVGRGARVRLANGRTLLDFASGIGVYGFGHSDRDLLEIAVAAAAGDTVFQGHLFPGPEYVRLSRALLRNAGPRIKHAWLSISGAIANENALKLILQKHAPADRIVAFERNFAGRTLALAEISDKPAYLDGLPLRGNVLYVPFYDPDAPEKSLAALEAHLARHPGRIAGMIFEIVQGEGGFNTAPREFFVGLMERCREAGIAVWVDEVQTFARTGELFAYRTFGLEDYVDVVTAGKTLQGSAALFTRTYNPKPGLIAGTYAGSTVGMAVGTRIIERLEEGFLGADGRIAVLGGRVERRIEALRKRMPRAVGARTGLGAMHAFVPFDGSAEIVSAVLKAAFEEGLFAFSAGANPTKIRMLLPVNTTDEELEAGFAILEKAMRRVAGERDLPVLILRPIEPGDLDALVDLAHQLDSMNLPAERTFLAERIATSERSFAGDFDDWREGIYVFVLEDTDAGRCVGTSSIIAKHGRPGAPYFWLAVTTEERRNAELDKRFVHTKLQLQSTEDGPTEIGGLILDPAYRHHKEKCGKALSIVRFAYISAHPDRFEREVIAEMLSPFEQTGENLLWDAFGAKFTGLPYREADHLSAHSKQFIADLFPRDPVYATLFPERVQAAIGQPNETAKAAVRILEKIGFRELHQVDPFDGGPYLGASRDAIASVRERRQLVLPGVALRHDTPEDGPLALVSADGPLGFRARVVPLDEQNAPIVSPQSREALGVDAGDRVSVTPLP